MNSLLGSIKRKKRFKRAKRHIPKEKIADSLWRLDHGNIRQVDRYLNQLIDTSHFGSYTNPNVREIAIQTALAIFRGMNVQRLVSENLASWPISSDVLVGVAENALADMLSGSIQFGLIQNPSPDMLAEFTLKDGVDWILVNGEIDLGNLSDWVLFHEIVHRGQWNLAGITSTDDLADPIFTPRLVGDLYAFETDAYYTAGLLEAYDIGFKATGEIFEQKDLRRKALGEDGKRQRDQFLARPLERFVGDKLARMTSYFVGALYQQMYASDGVLTDTQEWIIRLASSEGFSPEASARLQVRVARTFNWFAEIHFSVDFMKSKVIPAVEPLIRGLRYDSVGSERIDEIEGVLDKLKTEKIDEETGFVPPGVQLSFEAYREIFGRVLRGETEAAAFRFIDDEFIPRLLQDLVERRAQIQMP